MRKLPLWMTVAALFCMSAPAAAHTGGPLDLDGCHADHRTGNYHCHRGAAAGYTFPNKAAMEEAVRTGVFPDKTVDEEGFFQRLWPWGKHHQEEEPAAESKTGDGAASPAPAPSSGVTAPAPATGESAPAPASGAAAPAPSGEAAAAVPEKQREFEQKLKVLQGLYEMGLITKDEYEAKRKAVLDQL